MSRRSAAQLVAFDRERLGGRVKRIAGVDEAGRGPLAGPVVAAAVILPLEEKLPQLCDSKRLSPRRREGLYEEICRCAVAWAVGVCGPTVIDRINVLQATLLAMEEAVRQLSPRPQLLLVDGRQRIPGLGIRQELVCGGDGRSASIAAASVIAKVTRDRIMAELDKLFPRYGFARHKGYATRRHLRALRRYGPCAVHRLSFAPVRRCLRGPVELDPTGLCVFLWPGGAGRRS